MREILFRGKTSGNEWLYGNLSVIGDCCFISEDMGFSKTVIPETVGQYTGLTDKNGKKIFEGDILESRYDEKYPNDFCHEVVIWHDNGWCIKEGNYEPDRLDEDQELKYSIVVGNIHDNPELLKGGESDA